MHATDVFPIPGTKRAACLEENMGALAVSMSPEDVAELEAAVPEDEIVGTRYPNHSVSPKWNELVLTPTFERRLECV